ncbi:MAG: hypothetical protein ACRC2T_06140, partial [Thermoguttaceae bacterium]
NLDPDAMKSMLKLEKDAELNGIRVITVPELLRRMGWQSAANVKGYGKLATSADLAISPSKRLPVSNGSVSQIYTNPPAGQFDDSKTNLKSAKNPISQVFTGNESAPPTKSTGRVSQTYGNDLSPNPKSNGSVSGIFGGD